MCQYKKFKTKRKEKECTSINPVEFNLDDESNNNPENETFFDLVTLSLINNHFGKDDVTTDLRTMVAPSIDHEILLKTIINYKMNAFYTTFWFLSNIIVKSN